MRGINLSKTSPGLAQQDCAGRSHWSKIYKFSFKIVWHFLFWRNFFLLFFKVKKNIIVPKNLVVFMIFCPIVAGWMLVASSAMLATNAKISVWYGRTGFTSMKEIDPQANFEYKCASLKIQSFFLKIGKQIKRFRIFILCGCW